MVPFGSLLYWKKGPGDMSSDQYRYRPSGEKIGSLASCWSFLRLVSPTPAPPSGTLNIHISPAPRLRSLVKCFLATMYLPLGCHDALLSSRKSSFVIWTGLPPSEFMHQMLSPPPRSLVNKIILPSG